MKGALVVTAVVMILLPVAEAGAAGDGPAVVPDTTYAVNAEDDADDGACDLGHCSLREAINAANARPGTDTISFAIPGTGQRMISPTSALPTIVDPLVIDATTQPDFTGNLIIELDGTAAGPSADGLRITGGNSIVRGLVIKLFATAIRLESNGANTVERSIIGADYKTLQCQPNTAVGIRIDSSDNTIGGTTSTANNVIACSGGDGIYIVGGSRNAILGNAIGTDPAGAAPLPNARDGIRIEDGSDNTIGGPGAFDGNLIAYNQAAGVSVRGSGSADNLVTGNTITQNGGTGIELPDAGTGNEISSNSSSANAGLAIDLGPTGVTPNDLGDSDTGPNDLQNYPELRSALARLGGILVRGSLDSRPNTDFALEFFRSPGCDASDHGEGAALLRATTLTSDGSGDADFEVDVDGFFLPGEVITATATDSDGNTSEFSACAPVTDFTLTVSPDSVIVVRGQDAKYAVDISSQGGAFAEPIALSCSDLPGLTACAFEPDTLIPGSASVRSVLTVTTTVAAAIVDGPSDFGRTVPPSGPLMLGLASAALVAFALLGRGSRRRKLSLALVSSTLLLVTVISSSCGDDGTGPATGGTPVGKHEFTVTATAEPLSHSGMATLIVR